MQAIAQTVIHNRIHTAMALGNVGEVRRMLRLGVALRKRVVTPAEAWDEVLSGVQRDLITLIPIGGQDESARVYT